MKESHGNSRYFLALSYLIVGVAWVVGSDYVLGEATNVPVAVHLISSLKGTLFVVASAVLLFVVQSQRVAATSPAQLSPGLGGGAISPFLIYMITCAGVLLGGVVLYQQQWTEVRQKASATLVDTAAMTGRQVESWVAERRTRLEFAGRDPLLAHAIITLRTQASDIPGSDVRGGLDVLRQSEGFERVQIFSASGAPVAHAGEPVALTPQLQFWMRGANATGRVVMSDLYVPADAQDGKPVVDFVVTVMRDNPANVVAGILVARANPDQTLFPVLAASVTSTSGISLSLIRHAGDAVAVLLPPGQRTLGSSGYQHLVTDAAAAVKQVAGGRSGAFTAKDELGKAMIATGRSVAGTPWMLVATVPEDSVFAPLRRAGRLGLMVALAALVVSGWLVIVWLRGERQAMAEQLDAAERRNSLLKEHFAIAGRFVHDIVLLLDQNDATIVEANDRAVDAYGYSREDLLARTIFDLRPQGSAEQTEALQRFAALRASGGGNYVTRHWRKDGSSFPIELSARYCEMNGYRYVQIIGRDITERIHNEERLAAMSAERDRVLERLQRQFDQMATACIVLSTEGNVLQINPAHERVFGYGPAHVVGRNVHDFVKNRDFLDVLTRWFEQLRHDPDATLSGVFDNTTLAGEPITCRWTATALRDAQGRFGGMIGMAEDITEQVAAERALRNSEARYRSLTEISPVGIFRTDLAGQTVFVNSRCCEIIGMTADECLGRGWARAIHADDAAATAHAWEAYVQSHGTLHYAPECRIVRPDGRIVWVLAQIAPELGLDGIVRAHIGTITDVTALKDAQLELRQARDHLEERVAERTTELKQAKDAAEHSDRVKSAFLSTMSHELRTPLNSILGFTDVLLQGLSGPLSEPQERQLRIVRESATHLRSLIEDVLDISRIEAGQIALEFTDLDLRDLISRRVEAFGAEYERKGIKLEVHAAGDMPTIRSDRKRAGQVVNNLLSNALKFTDKGSVTVDIRCAGEHLELRVMDTGIGIPESALTHLFNPFTQVIRPGGRMNEGTGLGLAISRNLARALGGDLAVESEVGRGSCFTFRLPRVAREVDDASASGVFPRLHVGRPLPHDAAHDAALSASTQT